MLTRVGYVSLRYPDLPLGKTFEFTCLLLFLGHVMRMLANRQVFRETEYGSDVFVNNRMSSILLTSNEKNLRGFIGHWYEPIVDYRHSSPGVKHYAHTGPTTVIVLLILRSKRSDLRTPTSRSSKSTTECLSGTTSVFQRGQWLVRGAIGPWSVRNLSYTGG